MAEFETSVSLWSKAKINSWNIGSIIEAELANILGDKDRWIRNGYIVESDYRFNGVEEIREATPEEIELYKSFRLVAKHFKQLK
ncbi:hypothetical protein [Halalkalibacter oceani]|uniref:hypothetical protein n=1 Tax=Halalkalibacter oceani TaxID=1653776 RepID=UPI00339A9D99